MRPMTSLLSTLCLALALVLMVPASASASALELTQRQVELASALDTGAAKKITKRLLELDTAGVGPIYLMISATGGTAQGTLMVADTIAALKSPVVAVVVTEVRGAGAAAALFCDRVEVLPSAGFVFTEVPYQGVKKPTAPPKPKKGETAPEVKAPEPGEVLLQKARTQYLDRFWGRVASRMKMKGPALKAMIADGGFIMTADEALKQKVADARIDQLSLRPLVETKKETKVTSTFKRQRTPDAGDATGTE